MWGSVCWLWLLGWWFVGVVKLVRCVDWKWRIGVGVNVGDGVIW